jgi:hypothetical protein
MVFDINKYTDIIESILEEKEPQVALDDWIMNSPTTKKPLTFTTYLPRKTTLRKFLKNNYDFDYYINPDEIDEFKQIGIQKFEARTEKSFEIDIDILVKFIENMEAKLDEELEFTPQDKTNYNLVLRRDKNRISIHNRINNLIIYLMITSGRRINEFHNKIIGESKEEPGSILFNISKRKVPTVGTFKPAIDSDKWLEIYEVVQPFITDVSIETLTKRINKFLKTLEPTFTTHTLRKVYAYFCERRDKSKRTKLVKRKDCLNHKNTGTSVRYRVVKKTPKKRCEVCDVEVSKLPRHNKTKKHLKNLENQN